MVLLTLNNTRKIRPNSFVSGKIALFLKSVVLEFLGSEEKII